MVDKEKIDWEKLVGEVKYNPQTGEFTRIQNIDKNGMVRRYFNRPCRYGGSGGYLHVKYQGKTYLAHRLAWFYVYKVFPNSEIDHINGDKTDNRIENLRDVSKSCNLRNFGVSANTTTGVRGVGWHKGRKKYMAYIFDPISGNIQLGQFKTLYDAATARHKAEIKYGYPECRGSSSAKEYINNQSPGRK